MLFYTRKVIYQLLIFIPQVVFRSVPGAKQSCCLLLVAGTKMATVVNSWKAEAKSCTTLWLIQSVSAVYIEGKWYCRNMCEKNAASQSHFQNLEEKDIFRVFLQLHGNLTSCWPCWRVSYQTRLCTCFRTPYCFENTRPSCQIDTNHRSPGYVMDLQ